MNIPVGKSKIYQNLYIFPIMNIEWLLYNANSAIFKLYYGENMLLFNDMVMGSAVLDQHA
jgi:hypothetical protein